MRKLSIMIIIFVLCTNLCLVSTSAQTFTVVNDDDTRRTFEYLGRLVITELLVDVPLYVEYSDVEEPDFFQEDIAIMYWDGTVITTDGNQFDCIGDVTPGMHAVLTAPDGSREFWRCVNVGIGEKTEGGLYDQFGNFWNSWFWPITIYNNVEIGSFYITQWIKI